MKKTFLLILLGTTSLFLVKCTSKKAATTGVSPDSKASVDEIKRNFTPAQMEEGHAIASSHCNKCHKYHEAGEFTIGKWEKVLPSMIGKAQLNEADAGKVRAYLITNAKG